MELDMRKFQSKVRNMNIGTLLIFSAPFVSGILTFSVIDLNKREPSFTKKHRYGNCWIKDACPDLLSWIPTDTEECIVLLLVGMRSLAPKPKRSLCYHLYVIQPEMQTQLLRLMHKVSCIATFISTIACSKISFLKNRWIWYSY